MYLLVLSYLHHYVSKEYKNTIYLERYLEGEYIVVKYGNGRMINFRLLCYGWSSSTYCGIGNIFAGFKISIELTKYYIHSRTK